MYSSPNVIRVVRSWKDELDGACSMHGGEKICLLHVCGETVGKHFIWEIRRRRGNDIKVDIVDCFGWINLAHKRVM